MVRGETVISFRDLLASVCDEGLLPALGKGSDCDLVEVLEEEARCQCGEVLSTHIGSGASRLTPLGSREVERHA